MLWVYYVAKKPSVASYDVRMLLIMSSMMCDSYKQRDTKVEDDELQRQKLIYLKVPFLQSNWKNRLIFKVNCNLKS